MRLTLTVTGTNLYPSLTELHEWPGTLYTQTLSHFSVSNSNLDYWVWTSSSLLGTLIYFKRYLLSNFLSSSSALSDPSLWWNHPPPFVRGDVYYSYIKSLYVHSVLLSRASESSFLKSVFSVLSHNYGVTPSHFGYISLSIRKTIIRSEVYGKIIVSVSMTHKRFIYLLTYLLWFRRDWDSGILHFSLRNKQPVSNSKFPCVWRFECPGINHDHCVLFGKATLENDWLKRCRGTTRIVVTVYPVRDSTFTSSVPVRGKSEQCSS